MPGPPPRQDEIADLTTPDLVRRFARGVENFDRRVLSLNDSQLDTAFLPAAGVGRWPCRVLLGHVADADLAYVHRLRRAAAEESPVFAPWDENAFIDAGLYRQPVAGYLAVIHALRQWTAEWLTGLDGPAWSRRALHPEAGPQTVRSIAEQATRHLEHHARFLNLKVEKFLGPRPAE
jgi:hypothetical protein